MVRDCFDSTENTRNSTLFCLYMHQSLYTNSAYCVLLFTYLISRRMYSLNRAQLIGNVTADPEVRALPSGQRVANFSIATNRRYTDSA